MENIFYSRLLIIQTFNNFFFKLNPYILIDFVIKSKKSLFLNQMTRLFEIIGFKLMIIRISESSARVSTKILMQVLGPYDNSNIR